MGDSPKSCQGTHKHSHRLLQEKPATGQQPDLVRMTISQKPAAIAQPRRRPNRRHATPPAQHSAPDAATPAGASRGRTADSPAAAAAPQEPAARQEPPTTTASSAAAAAATSIPLQAARPSDSTAGRAQEPDLAQRASAPLRRSLAAAINSAAAPAHRALGLNARSTANTLDRILNGAASLHQTEAAEPAATPQRQTARKRTEALSGAAAAASSAAHSAPAQQGWRLSPPAPDLLSMLDSPQPAASLRAPSTANANLASSNRQTAALSLSAALEGATRASMDSAQPNVAQLAQQATHENPFAGSRSAQQSSLRRCRAVSDQAKSHSAWQAFDGEGRAPDQAAGGSGTPVQKPHPAGGSGKRPAEPVSERPAKRASHAGGGLLGIAMGVMENFARQRLGGADRPATPQVRIPSCRRPFGYPPFLRLASQVGCSS